MGMPGVERFGDLGGGNGGLDGILLGERGVINIKGGILVVEDGFVPEDWGWDVPGCGFECWDWRVWDGLGRGLFLGIGVGFMVDLEKIFSVLFC